MILCVDCKIAVTGSSDNTARIWQIDTGELVRVLDLHTNYVNAVVLSPNGKVAMTGSLLASGK